jgi:type I restriction enzyme M protein
VLFRTNETAFVQTKRKLLEECDLWCVVSLPGGVFPSGTKTSMMFFTRGRPTETIWYYDLSDVKVGKKAPLTREQFTDFFQLLPERRASERSWSVPFAARLQEALEQARPDRERAADLFAQAAGQEDALREKRKAKSVSSDQLARLEEEWKAVLREAREAQARAEAVENAVYDLKAVNPNRAADEDRRTPAQLLTLIEEKGREADAALARLKELIARPSWPRA